MFPVKEFLHAVRDLVLQFYILLKFSLLKDYYAGIALQTEYDYRHSERFKMRYEVVGFDEAMKMYNENLHEREYLFNQTRNCALLIRLAHLRDAILKRKPQPYERG